MEVVMIPHTTIVRDRNSWCLTFFVAVLNRLLRGWFDAIHFWTSSCFRFRMTLPTWLRRMSGMLVAGHVD